MTVFIETKYKFEYNRYIVQWVDVFSISNTIVFLTYVNYNIVL